MKNSGYLFFAFGNDYIQGALNLAKTIRKQGDKKPISLVTSNVKFAESLQIFDKVIFYDPEDDPLVKNNVIKTNHEKFCVLPKLRIIELTPYDEVMYLDVDVLAIGSTRWAWRELRRHHQDINVLGHYYGVNNLWQWKEIDRICADNNLKIPEVHGGLIYIKDKNSPIVQKVFAHAVDVCCNFDSYKLVRWFRGNSMCEEIMFAIAYAKENLVPLDCIAWPMMTLNLSCDTNLPTRTQTIEWERGSHKRFECSQNIPFTHQWEKFESQNYKKLLLKILESNMSTPWEEANSWESSWWGNCTNTWLEEQKQLTFAAKIGLYHNGWGAFDMQKKRILDIGGGPTSLLLKCRNFSEAKIVDPCKYPDWIARRYAAAGIKYQVIKGEDVNESGYDEVWMYNVLQHVENPELIVKNALRAGKLLRLFEWIDVPTHVGHIHMLTEANLNKWLGNVGTVEDFKSLEKSGCLGHPKVGKGYHIVMPTSNRTEYVIDSKHTHLGGNIRGGDPFSFTPKLWDWLIEKFNIQSVLDVGCGEGHSTKYFRDKGISTIGFDGLALNVQRAVTPITQHDLTKSTFNTPPVDLAWCCEVVEHIEEKHLDNLIETLRDARIIAMTHALPGAGGHHHVNCQDKQYWIDKFSKSHDWLEVESNTSRKLAETPDRSLSHYSHTGLIFKKKEMKKYTRPDKLRFHVVGFPHTTTTKEHNACAYTAKVYKFCQMMLSEGHEVFHYGTEGSNPPCTKHINLLRANEYERFFGDHDYKKNYYPNIWNNRFPYWVIVNNRAVEEIKKNTKKGDFVCLIAGNCQQPIMTGLKGLPVQVVEYGIGYYGVFAPHRVYESYAHMHTLYGMSRPDPDGGFFDAVIPNYFDINDFTFQETPEDYYLYIGRMIHRKGINIAVEATAKAGKKLLMCGQGVTKVENGKIYTQDSQYYAPHAEYVGYADTETRDKLMRNAKAILVPTIYVEPFGGVAVEAQLCGTPVICTDWGAMTETVLHGVTGFRCRTLEQFVFAINEAPKLDRNLISQIARSRYSLETVAKMYTEYFYMLSTLWGEGWYEKNNTRTELNWLNSPYLSLPCQKCQADNP